MATLFARKYMRKLEEVPTSEKMWGVALLVLICGVVAAFVIQSYTDTHKLFTVDAALYKSNKPARPHLVARQMLPAMNDPRWKDAEDAETIRLDELTGPWASTGSDLAAFGAAEVFRRRYELSASPGDDVVVLVCDVATPAQAFGMCRQRRPADGAPLSIGQDGWTAENGRRAGFWNGRYYTEVVASDQVDAGAAEAVVAFIASRQLPIGGPFEAEALLPGDGRVPDSFRYVHKAAFGLAALNNAFMVEIPNAVTAWVVDAGSETNARRLCGEIEHSAVNNTTANGDTDVAEEGAGLAAPTVRHDGPLTIVQSGTSTWAFFQAGRHLHGTFGNESGPVKDAALAYYEETLFRTAAGAPQTPAIVAANGENPFPDPGVDGWQAPRAVDRFSADDLYVKINGRADAYLNFHVVGLTFGTYYNASQAGQALDVYWYDMGEAPNAHGIYRAEAAAGAAPVPIGREGYETGGAVFFHKGSSYVQVLPSNSDDTAKDVALAVAQRVAEVIIDDDSGDTLWATKLLPASGQIADSFVYLVQDAFGLDFLPEVYTADYEAEGGGRVTLFVHRAADAAEAQGLLDRYAESFEDFGRVLWRDENPERHMVAGEVAGSIDVVFAKGRYLGGVAGAEDAATAKQEAVRFFASLAIEQLGINGSNGESTDDEP